MLVLRMLPVLLFSFASLPAPPLSFSISGDAAILMNAESRAILFEKNAHVRLFPASTTKIAIGLYTLKFFSHELDTVITAEQDALASISPEAKLKSNFTMPSHWLETDAMHMGIKKGEQMTLRDLLAGALIPSADDAANVIAKYCGKSIPEYMKQLNLYLASIGCKNTHFLNPHGLHHPEHQSTAYDLALMTTEALKEPLFCEMVAQPRFIRPKTNKQASVPIPNTNRLVRPGAYYYSKAIGVKTGWHSRSKSTFVGAARHGGRTLIVVLLGYANRKTLFEEAVQLFEVAFNQPKIHRTFLAAGDQPYTLSLPNSRDVLKTHLQEELSLDYYPAEDPQVKCILNWKALSLPIAENQEVAEIVLTTREGAVLKKAPLLAREPVEWAWPQRWVQKLPAALRITWLSAFLSLFFAFIAGTALYMLLQSRR